MVTIKITREPISETQSFFHYYIGNALIKSIFYAY